MVLLGEASHGGIVLAQQPEDAAFSSMPRAAVSTGQVDIVLPVPEMPQKLMELWSNANRIHLPSDDEAAGSLAGTADTEHILREIVMILRTRTSHDFRQYKRATVLRRIERRMQVNGLSELSEYRDFLHGHPEETPLLLQDMLISVTNFFRDREAFAIPISSICRTVPGASCNMRAASRRTTSSRRCVPNCAWSCARQYSRRCRPTTAWRLAASSLSATAGVSS
ncbi:hypothetical protein LMG23994_00422 [Cupriavidus pinatubonensis]|uniref:CheR-type methyltransferase domain-containing protein n=1 Tax=Cupriavidus pinatubonensis TaxID=248026 RepID=A0ABN7XU86_9BURK|nr:hypothetical protein LMG23994_00422 [Cupriavidus pinatubonensis]